jgi:hypothetical protein
VLATGHHPTLLKNAVTTPAGCTINGILELEEGKLRVTLIKGVVRITTESYSASSTAGSDRQSANVFAANRCSADLVLQCLPCPGDEPRNTNVGPKKRREGRDIKRPNRVTRETSRVPASDYFLGDAEGRDESAP